MNEEPWSAVKMVVVAAPAGLCAFAVYGEDGPTEAAVVAIASEVPSRWAPMGTITLYTRDRKPYAAAADHEALEQDDARSMQYCSVALLLAHDWEDGHWLRLGTDVFWSKAEAQAECDRLETQAST